MVAGAWSHCSVASTNETRAAVARVAVCAIFAELAPIHRNLVGKTAEKKDWVVVETSRQKNCRHSFATQ